MPIELGRAELTLMCCPDPTAGDEESGSRQSGGWVRFPAGVWQGKGDREDPRLPVPACMAWGATALGCQLLGGKKPEGASGHTSVLARRTQLRAGVESQEQRLLKSRSPDKLPAPGTQRHPEPARPQLSALGARPLPDSHRQSHRTVLAWGHVRKRGAVQRPQSLQR